MPVSAQSENMQSQTTRLDPLLRVENLRTYFFTEEATLRAVDDVSLEIYPGRTLGLVGESGCGKSVTALSIMRLVAPPGQIVGGKITYHDEDGVRVLTELSEPEMRKVRGGKIAMIFQEPMTSLNPVFTVGSQILEAIRLHHREEGNRGGRISAERAKQLMIDSLKQVGIPDAEKRWRDYPHQFSGGMRQRVMIAMALACRPKLLIADEPTTALDVTIQAQILELLREIQQKQRMAILIITHDLGVVAELAHEVAVMYASKIVERAPVETLFTQPLHPYTVGLLRSRPRLGEDKGKKLATIKGNVPNPKDFPPGCKFHPRCDYCQEICRQQEPELRVLAPGHWVRCHFAGELSFDDVPTNRNNG
ncbi:MAG: ABC transporter ATP-binding protein [Thermogutta sp.]